MRTAKIGPDLRLVTVRRGISKRSHEKIGADQTSICYVIWDEL